MELRLSTATGLVRHSDLLPIAACSSLLCLCMIVALPPKQGEGLGSPPNTSKLPWPPMHGWQSQKLHPFTPLCAMTDVPKVTLLSTRIAGASQLMIKGPGSKLDNQHRATILPLYEDC